LLTFVPIYAGKHNDENHRAGDQNNNYAQHPPDERKFMRISMGWVMAHAIGTMK